MKATVTIKDSSIKYEFPLTVLNGVYHISPIL